MASILESEGLDETGEFELEDGCFELELLRAAAFLAYAILTNSLRCYSEGLDFA